MKLEQVIGTGAQATVYRSGVFAVKVFNGKRPTSDVLYEAFITSKIAETGLPVPRIREVVTINKSMAIKMDLAQGRSLFDLMIKHPTKTEHYMDEMVKLQMSIHSKTLHIPIELKDRLHERILNCHEISPSHKKKMLKLLKTLPEDTSLCHGDFHGYNILMDSNDYWIIDWVDASRGHPLADVCRTYMLYTLHCGELADLYLNSYCRIADVPHEDILRWFPVVATARLSDKIDGEDSIIKGWIEENFASIIRR